MSRARTMVTHTGRPQRAWPMATISVENPQTEPQLKSMPPAMITYGAESARTPVMAHCLRRFVRLYSVMKFFVPTEATMKITAMMMISENSVFLKMLEIIKDRI